MFDNIIKFLNYWYFRYLLVTELYMVEKWERIMIHIVFAIIFTLISIVNTYAILGLIGWLSALCGFQDFLHDAQPPLLRNEL